MTEAEWNNCTDPARMLEALRDKASDRKLMLFGCACQRRILHLPYCETARKVVEALEPFVDGLVERAHLPESLRDATGMGVASICSLDAALSSARLGLLIGADEQRFQAALLRDIFGDPIRPLPALSPSLLTSDVLALARRAYEERTLPEGTLDWGRLAVLANALEAAGYDNEEILGHVRERGRIHVRGCWVLDYLLGIR